MMSLDEAIAIAHDDVWDHPAALLEEAAKVLTDKTLYEIRLIIELKLAYLGIFFDSLDVAERNENISR
jgi:hypothetical protein